MPPLARPLPGETSVVSDPPDDGSGYSLEHRTRPLTIGYSLTDSPACLAAWIVKKLDAWTDPRSRLSRDTVLDNVMHDWLPRTGASAARLYWEILSDVGRWIDGPLQPRDLVSVPVGGVIFPAWEEPARFTAEMSAFFGPLR